MNQHWHFRIQPPSRFQLQVKIRHRRKSPDYQAEAVVGHGHTPASTRLSD